MSAQKTASDKCPCDYHDTPGYSPKGDPDAPLPKPPKGGTGAVYPDTPERICTGEGDRCKPYMDGPGWGWWNKWLDRMSGEQFNALLDKIEAMPDDDFPPTFPHLRRTHKAAIGAPTCIEFPQRHLFSTVSRKVLDRSPL